MAPVKSVKTYATRRRSGKKSEREEKRADNLFQLNLQKQTRFKKKKKLAYALKEVGLSNGKTQLSSDSLNVTVNNTFDRLLKGDLHQPVKFTANAKCLHSDSDSSKSKSHLLTSATVYSPIVFQRKRRKGRSTKIKKVEPEHKSISVHKNHPVFDQSVHTSLEVEKCNFSSLYRYNYMTPNELSIQQSNSINVSFGVPKVCSTPMMSLKTYNNDIMELNSPVSSKTRSRKKQLSDLKLVKVPFVNVTRNFGNRLPNVEVEANESNTETTKITDMSCIPHSTPNYVNTKRRGRPPRSKINGNLSLSPGRKPR